MPVFIPHANLAKILGVDYLHSDAQSIRDLLDEVRSKIDDSEWEQAKRASILVNGRNIHFLDGFDTPLAPTDQVWMIYPSGGG